MHPIIQLLAFAFIIHVMVIPAFADLEGPNVCEKTEEVKVLVTKQVSTPYKVTTSELCLKPPFRCRKEKLAYKLEHVDEYKTTNKTFKVCCEGYAQVGNYCVAFNGTQTIIENLIAPDPLKSGHASSPGIWIATSLTLLLVVAIFMLLLFRYKKKLHSVKEELNYVTYTVERGSSCGSSANYAAPSESGCSGLSVTPNVKNNNLVHVVNQLKSDPTKVSNIEKAAALKKAIELEDEHPLRGALAMKPSSSKQLFKPTANPNLYYSTTSVKSDKEPIYEELPDVPATDESYSTSISDDSEADVNDLSTSSMYDRPRAPNTLNITPGDASRGSTLPNSPSENGSFNPFVASSQATSSSHESSEQSTSCQSPPVPVRPAPVAPDASNVAKNEKLYSNEEP